MCVLPKVWLYNFFFYLAQFFFFVNINLIGICGMYEYMRGYIARTDCAAEREASKVLDFT